MKEASAPRVTTTVRLLGRPHFLGLSKEVAQASNHQPSAYLCLSEIERRSTVSAFPDFFIAPNEIPPPPQMSNGPLAVSLNLFFNSTVMRNPPQSEFNINLYKIINSIFNILSKFLCRC